MIIKIPNRNKTVSGIAPQIANYHCHMVDIPPFSKAQRLYQHKCVEGFEPSNLDILEVKSPVGFEPTFLGLQSRALTSLAMRTFSSIVRRSFILNTIPSQIISYGSS